MTVPDTIRLSRTIEPVATGTQWSGPVKLRIVYEFLASRTTESDRGSEPVLIHFRTQPDDPISCHGKPVERTNEIKGYAI